MPDNDWTELPVPASDYAFDANYWNSLTAPQRNLDYLYESQYKSNAYLHLSYTGSVAAGATFTTIPWTTAVSQNYSTMWNSGNPTYIQFDTGGGGVVDTRGLWGITLIYQYNTATAFTERRAQLAFNAGSAVAFTLADAYEDNGTNQEQHTFFMPWLSGFFLPTSNDYMQVQVRHASTTTPLTITAVLFVEKIPSPVNNFIGNIV